MPAHASGDTPVTTSCHPSASVPGAPLAITGSARNGASGCVNSDVHPGLLAPLAQACAAELPFPNPVGVPAPAAGAPRA